MRVNPWPKLEASGALVQKPRTTELIGDMLDEPTRDGLEAAVERLQSAGYVLERERAIHLGDFGRFVPLSPKEAVKWMEAQPAQFQRQLYVTSANHSMTHEPLTRLQHLRDLDALYGLAEAASGPCGPALRACRSLMGLGWDLSSTDARGRTSKDAFCLIKTLTSDEPVPRVLRVSKFKGSAMSHYIAQPVTANQRRMESLEDLVAADYFEGSGTDHGLAHAEAARGLKTLRADGYHFWPQNDVFECYRRLSESKHNLEVRVGNQDVSVTVTRDELGKPAAIADRIQTAQRIYQGAYQNALRKMGLQRKDGELIERFVDASMEPGSPSISAELRAAVLADQVRSEPSERGAIMKAVQQMQQMVGASSTPTDLFTSASTDGRVSDLRLCGSLEKMSVTLGSVRTAVEAARELESPLGNTDTIEERLALLMTIAGKEGANLCNTLQDYQTASRRGQRGVESMVTLLETMSLRGEQANANKVFLDMDARFPDPDAFSDAIMRLAENMVVQKTTEAALAGALREPPSKSGGQVRQDGMSVLLGGIRVLKNVGLSAS